MKRKKEKRPTDCPMDGPLDGPLDGVIFKTECIRTDFDENEKFTQRDKGESSITASKELGVFSIRDKVSGVMITISFYDAVEVIAKALDAAKEIETTVEINPGE